MANKWSPSSSQFSSQNDFSSALLLGTLSAIFCKFSRVFGTFLAFLAPFSEPPFVLEGRRLKMGRPETFWLYLVFFDIDKIEDYCDRGYGNLLDRDPQLLKCPLCTMGVDLY